MGTTATVQLTGRDRAILRAVDGGAAELSGGNEPDLFLDGRSCCDQAAARRLVRLGLIASAVEGAVGRRGPATLTADGRTLIGAAAAIPAAVCSARIITGCWRVRGSH